MPDKNFKYSDLRAEYSSRGLHRADLDPNPFRQFQAWFEVACSSGTVEPNAFCLATATPEGKPSCRFVLMKHLDAKGLLFFTNYHSRKGNELKANGQAAACFWWSNLERQVRLEGFIEMLSTSRVAEYFSRRPRKSQLGAWASKQGEYIASKQVLETAFEDYACKFEGQDVPCPPFWGGYRLIPTSFEFWQGSTARLHDRFVYSLVKEMWHIERLSP